ncbi:hypothetical protein BJV74DRAFT_800146 [Russula compacta]|nr:hypothetical protein BJV74DRAFT_800146 [Russula compacta]
MIAAHVKKCECMKESEEGLVKYECKVRHKVERLLARPSGSNAADPLTSNDSGPPGSPDLWPVLEIASHSLSVTLHLLDHWPSRSRLQTPTLESSTILGVVSLQAYHPKVYSACKSSSHDKPNLKPWWPFFKTCEDFLILEILIDSSLSNAQLDKLLKLINRCINNLQAAWDHVSLKLTPPWTLDVFWDAQIPDGGHVLTLILYANKMKLSSFGTAKGYPVVMCCVDLPQKFRMEMVSVVDASLDGCLWTAADTQTVIKDARKLQSAAKCEKLLLHLSLRDVDNVFWNLSYSDLHHVLSFDQLHSNNSGLFGHHLWEQFKILITGYGHLQEEQVDKQYFEAHNIIPSHNWESEGWLLLQCLRAFSIVDLYLAFEAHTEHTLTSGRHELESFAQCMKKYIHAFTSCGESNKSWHFPKMHALVHSFDDIKQKGATHNYNTRPNKKLHGPLKKTYKMNTNFKDIGPQIQRATLIIVTPIDFKT